MKIKHNGYVVVECKPCDVDSTLAVLNLSLADVEVELSPDEQKQAIRDAVNRVADAASREAVMSDTIAVVVIGFAQMVVGNSKAQDPAIREAAALMLPIAQAVLGAIDSQKLVPPFIAKGRSVQDVLGAMMNLSNGVSQALQSSKQEPTPRVQVS